MAAAQQALQQSHQKVRRQMQQQQQQPHQQHHHQQQLQQQQQHSRRLRWLRCGLILLVLGLLDVALVYGLTYANKYHSHGSGGGTDADGSGGRGRREASEAALQAWDVLGGVSLSSLSSPQSSPSISSSSSSSSSPAPSSSATSSCISVRDKGLNPAPKFDYCHCWPEQRLLQRPPPDGAKPGAPVLQPGTKFVLLGMSHEQLSKARLHLAEAMVVAQLLNRTLVLPGAGESRLGLDRQLHLCSYFNTLKLAQFVPWVTLDALLPEMKAPSRPLKVLSLVLHTRRQRCDTSVWKNLLPKEGFEAHPLVAMLTSSLQKQQQIDRELQRAKQHRKKRGKESNGSSGIGLNSVQIGKWVTASSACVVGQPARNVGKAEEELRRRLEEEDVRDADVIVVFKTSSDMFFREHIIKTASDHVEFAPHLKLAATSMAMASFSPSSLNSSASIANFAARGSSSDGGSGGGGGPDFNEEALKELQRQQHKDARYLAVQWRTEYAWLQPKMSEQLFHRCLEGLLKAARGKLEGLNLSGVLIASDIAADGTPMSSSFTQDLPASAQRTAIVAVKRVFSELKPATWLTVDPAYAFLDSGVQGILDKLVCMQASFFLFAPRECGGMASSFTRDIISTRRKARRHFPYDFWRI